MSDDRINLSLKLLRLLNTRNTHFDINFTTDTGVHGQIFGGVQEQGGGQVECSKSLNKREKYLNKKSKLCSKRWLFFMTFPPYIAHFSMHQKGVIFWPLI